MTSEETRDPCDLKETSNRLDHGIPPSGIESTPGEQPALGTSNAGVGKSGQDASFHTFQDENIQQESQDDYDWLPSHCGSDLSSEMRRMLQLNCEEEVDDASSIPRHFNEPVDQFRPNNDLDPPKFPESSTYKISNDNAYSYTHTESYFREFTQEPHLDTKLESNAHFLDKYDREFKPEFQNEVSPSALQNSHLNALPATSHPLPPSNLPHTAPFWTPQSPSAYMRSKCALWDCSRPSEECGYCCEFHKSLAVSEGAEGKSPVMRPGGISVTDQLLFEALECKLQGQDVGLPTFDRAETNHIPWELPRLFHVTWVPGELLREWLYFSRKQRSGSTTRKQRNIPGYPGRGWHESRKMNFQSPKGVKRLLYLDPQPPGDTEWHLYEHELCEESDLSLHRLQMKMKEQEGNTAGSVGKKGGPRGRAGAGKSGAGVVDSDFEFRIKGLELGGGDGKGS